MLADLGSLAPVVVFGYYVARTVVIEILGAESFVAIRAIGGIINLG